MDGADALDAVTCVDAPGRPGQRVACGEDRGNGTVHVASSSASMTASTTSVRTPPKKAAAAIQPIKAPTLVIWGQGDQYLGEDLAEPDHDDVPNLERVERLPNASHCVHHDESERVTQLLIDFFASARTG